tara:strand:+ start:379 stop:570 length:192 start_codon:yes stop_codon:yes gene_type:complete
MKTYLVMVEGLVKRYISIEAANQSEAEDLAAEEFCALLGAERGYINQSEAVDENHELLSEENL